MGVAELVANGVITAEEARDILFNQKEEKETTKDKEIEALKEEVKFLRKLADELARKNNSWNTIYHAYRDFTPKYRYWYDEYQPLVMKYNNGNGITVTTGSMSLGMSAGGASSASMSTVSGLSTLNK